eukprot:scaffold301_cov243-Pinguiococcus_pyrenoidosus.AAC.162
MHAGMYIHDTDLLLVREHPLKLLHSAHQRFLLPRNLREVRSIQRVLLSPFVADFREGAVPVPLRDAVLLQPIDLPGGVLAIRLEGGHERPKLLAQPLILPLQLEDVLPLRSPRDGRAELLPQVCVFRAQLCSGLPLFPDKTRSRLQREPRLGRCGLEVTLELLVLLAEPPDGPLQRVSAGFRLEV